MNEVNRTMAKYEQCDDCGSDRMKVFWANRNTCLVAECAECGATVTSLQGNAPGHNIISRADDPRVV